MSRRNIPTSYAEADAFLGEKHDRPVANNTRVERNGFGGGRTIALRLHRTLVVVWREDGGIELRTGGWDTITTCDRINRALRGTPWRVGTDRGRMFLYYSDPCCEAHSRFAWREGVTVWANGHHDTVSAPKRTHRPHTNPECACAACRAKRDADMWRQRYGYTGARGYTPERPVEDYGSSAADGAACRAMANALRAIQRERKEEVTA